MTRSIAPDPNEYILGTGADELERLAVQHRIWADAAAAAWKLAGIGPGASVLDLGCGPGHALFDLGQLVTPAGRALGIDESERFVAYVNQQAGARSMPQVRALVADAQRLGAAGDLGQPFDAAYARWSLCWLPDPESAVRGVGALLRPGGRFVIHDYFNWQAMTIAPRSPAVSRMIDAAMQSYRDKTGDMDLCAKLPPMLKRAGFEIVHFAAHQRVARGGGHDSTIAWPVTWWRIYGPKLVAAEKLSKDDCAAALAEMDDLERNPDRFYVCPTVWEFIAVRR